MAVSTITSWDTLPLMVPMQLSADTVGVSRSTLYNLLEAGEIRAKQVGGRKFITKAELRRYIEGAEK